jgi:hypothetical protein
LKVQAKQIKIYQGSIWGSTESMSICRREAQVRNLGSVSFYSGKYTYFVGEHIRVKENHLAKIQRSAHIIIVSL